MVARLLSKCVSRAAAPLSEHHVTSQVALQDCTCLVYSEEHAQLLTGTPASCIERLPVRCLRRVAVRDSAALVGTSDGRVHIWMPAGGGRGKGGGNEELRSGEGAVAGAAHAMIDNA
jgi:hypothetical protein